MNFWLVKYFAGLLVNPLKKFHGFKFSRLLTFSRLVLQSISCTGYAVMSPFHRSFKFCGSFFHGSQLIREKCEILHHAKISHYTVTTEEVTSSTIAHLLCAVCVTKEKKSRGEWQLDYWPLHLSKGRKKNGAGHSLTELPGFFLLSLTSD